MRQTKKGNPWSFGMQVPVGTDLRGVIHAITTTGAATADITPLPQWLHGQEATRHGDKAYDKAEDKLQWELSGGRYLVNKRGARTTRGDAINRTRSRIRAMVEHPFQVITRQWGFTKVRYRGLAKHTVRVFALSALANLYRLRHCLLPQGTLCRRARRDRPTQADSLVRVGHIARDIHPHGHRSAHAEAAAIHAVRPSHLIRASLTTPRRRDARRPIVRPLP